LTDHPTGHDDPRVGTRNLPDGTVTFLFTDVEGSTKLLHALGADRYAEALATHRAQLRAAFTQHGGVEVDTQGDAFFIAFPTAPGALAAARAATNALTDGPIKIRIGLHTGTPLLTDEGYVGPDVHKGARIAAAGHGGQVLVSAATAQLIGGAELKDLGLHRLKDLTAPERIFQADPDEHPPLKTLHQTNLPIPATPFLGRAADLEALATLLARDDVRLVTLTGPGGTGKTRLALQAVADVADHFPHGVWWVPLAALRDPPLVLDSAARVLGAAGELAEHIGDKRLLLLLDNFEHLVSAAADLAPILAACPNLKLAVTSREPLHLDGEHEYAVDPLTRADSIELFVTRALAVNRGFSANGEVAAICDRLDHLPLAIELAAARVKFLSPAALLERLEQRLPLLAGGHRDAPERQRTLRATIEWSHELLTPEEQALFARLGVFRGGWTLEAAEAITDADLDTLQSLVDKSLVRVRPESGRFWMLETIREFAVERLESSDEADALRDRHTRHYAALAEEGAPQVPAYPRTWVPRLEPELDNLRAALDHLSDRRDADALGRGTAALAMFWDVRGYVAEGRRRLETALDLHPDPTVLRARLLTRLAALSTLAGEEARGEALATEALAINEQHGDEWNAAFARHSLGAAAASRGDYATARDHFERELEAFQQLGDQHQTLIARRAVAWMSDELGDLERYRSLTAENLELARRLGNERMEARALGALALDATYEGRGLEVVGDLQRVLRIDREVGEGPMTPVDLLRFAFAIARADPPLAARLVGAADAETERLLGSRVYESWAEGMRSAILDAVSLAPPDLDAALPAGQSMDFDAALEAALAWTG
jgi:predicted ATPase/class 3 adenylate cyclase